MKSIFLLFSLLSGFGLAAQTTNNDQQAVLEKVNKFFEALEKRDTILYKSLVMPDAQVWTVRSRNDSLINTMRTCNEDVTRLAASKNLIEEKPLSAEIKIHKDIAVVWMPYTINIGGKFSHCGIDVFTLLRTPDGWKMVSLAYSIEPDGCAALRGN